MRRGGPTGQRDCDVLCRRVSDVRKVRMQAKSCHQALGTRSRSLSQPKSTHVKASPCTDLTCWSLQRQRERRGRAGIPRMVGLYAKRFTLPRKYQALLRPESPLQSEVRRTGASITQVPRREMTRGRPDEPILGSTFEVFVVGSRDAIVRAAGRIERCVRAAWGGARVVLANSGDAKPRRSSSGQQARVDVTAFENRREDGRRAVRTRVRDSQGQPPLKRSRRRRSRSPPGDGNKQARSMLPSPLSSCPPAAQSKSQPLPHANRPWQPMQRQQRQQQQQQQQDKQIATRTPSTAGQNENRDDLSQQINPRTLQGKHFIELLTDSDSDCDQSISQSESELDIACDLCGRYDGEHSMILCDGCDAGFHIYCLDPPLSAIPRGDWFCQSCNPALNELRNSRRQKHEEVDRTRKWTNEEDARLASLMDDTSFTSWPARASALGTGRTPNAVYKRWQRYLSMQPENGEARGGRAHSPRTSVSLPKPSPAEKSRDLNNRTWTDEEDARLCSLMKDTSVTGWAARAEALGTGRTTRAVHTRWYRHLSARQEVDDAHIAESQMNLNDSLPKPSSPKPSKSTSVGSAQADKSRDVNNRTWTDEEDARLCSLMKDTSVTGWAARAEALGTGRTTRAVHTRWYRHLSTKQQSDKDQATQSHKSLDTLSPKPNPSKLSKTKNLRYPLGTRVVARWLGRKHWYAGVISRVNLDGSRDVFYDDGEEELGVKLRNIQEESVATPDLIDDTGNTSSDRAAAHDSSSSDGACYTEGALVLSPADAASLESADKAKVDTVVSCTGCDTESAIALLNKCMWVVESAVTRWFDRPVRLQAGTGVGRFKPSDVPASLWSTNGERQVTRGVWAPIRCSVFSGRSRERCPCSLFAHDQRHERRKRMLASLASICLGCRRFRRA
jgi:hypothetical protein